jgi:hypothetical protein
MARDTVFPQPTKATSISQADLEQSDGGLIRADAGFVCQSPFPATDCGQRWFLAPSPVSEQLLRRSKCSTETEQDSAAPPQVALESLVYRFVGPVKKQQRPSAPIDEQSSAEEDGEDRHRQSSIRSSRQWCKLVVIVCLSRFDDVLSYCTPDPLIAFGLRFTNFQLAELGRLSGFSVATFVVEPSDPTPNRNSQR